MLLFRSYIFNVKGSEQIKKLKYEVGKYMYKT